MRAHYVICWLVIDVACFLLWQESWQQKPRGAWRIVYVVQGSWHFASKERDEGCACVRAFFVCAFETCNFTLKIHRASACMACGNRAIKHAALLLPLGWHWPKIELTDRQLGKQDQALDEKMVEMALRAYHSRFHPVTVWPTKVVFVCFVVFLRGGSLLWERLHVALSMVLNSNMPISGFSFLRYHQHHLLGICESTRVCVCTCVRACSHVCVWWKNPATICFLGNWSESLLFPEVKRWKEHSVKPKRLVIL